jgi:4-aminobutyrate aminotransferase-like enzyme
VTKEVIILASRDFLFPSVFHYFDEPLVIERARDQFVWDADGNQYLDFFGGILTVSVGHCNENVNRAVRGQLDKLQHVSTVYSTEPQAALAKKIASITPGNLRQSFFTNSGTEANEMAITLARCFTGSSEIIALRHSYHGRSALAMAITGNAAWKTGPQIQPGIVHAHNAYCYRCPFGLTYPDCGIRCAHDLEELIRTATSGRVAGIIVEPIQGVGGFITPPKEYFQIVADIVRRHGGLFISDEVQTGWGRTGGKWFGIEHWGVTPDVITGAKGLGNGFPIRGDDYEQGHRRIIAGSHHLDLWRKSCLDHRRQSGYRSDRRAEARRQCRRDGRVSAFESRRAAAEILHRRRSPWHGTDAGLGTGGRPAFESSGREADPPHHGSRAP